MYNLTPDDVRALTAYSLIEGQIKNLSIGSANDIMRLVGKHMSDKLSGVPVLDIIGFPRSTCLSLNFVERDKKERIDEIQQAIDLVYKEDGIKPSALLEFCRDDANRWALVFCLTAYKMGYGPLPHDWMIGWFANAIENASDNRHQRKEKKESILHDLSEYDIDKLSGEAYATYTKGDPAFMLCAEFDADFTRCTENAVSRYKKDNPGQEPKFVFVNKRSWKKLSAETYAADLITFAHNFYALASGIVGLFDGMYIVSDAYWKIGTFITNPAVG